MNPAEFGISTLPLHHSPYPAISHETLAKSNKGKIVVVTGAAGGNEHGDKSPCVQGVKPQILKYLHQLQPPVTPQIWIL
jgi:hypothetical protein